MSKHPYRVRKVRSGYTGGTKYIVWKLGSGRVTVHAALSRDAAQHEADQLNIGHLVKHYDQDPRPYDVRRAEAEAAYRAEVGR